MENKVWDKSCFTSQAPADVAADASEFRVINH